MANSPKNSEIHFHTTTELYTKLKKQASEMGLPISELVRRKIEDDPTSEEIILLRRLKELFRSSGGKNGSKIKTEN